jgi:hypothetical protein
MEQIIFRKILFFYSFPLLSCYIYLMWIYVVFIPILGTRELSGKDRFMHEPSFILSNLR